MSLKPKSRDESAPTLPGAKERVRILRIESGWLLVTMPSEQDEAELEELEQSRQIRQLTGGMFQTISQLPQREPEPWEAEAGEAPKFELPPVVKIPARLRPRVSFFFSADELLKQLGGLLVPVGDAA